MGLRVSMSLVGGLPAHANLSKPMSKKTPIVNEYEAFLNECDMYVWEWYLPEKYVRFGVPSLNGLWIDDKKKIFRLVTVLERVHPDDIAKIFVSKNSPIYVTDEMFEVDLRLRLSDHYEWFVFRGKTLRRVKGRPVYLRGVAINADRRFRTQERLLQIKNYQAESERQKTEFCASTMQEVVTILETLASNSESIISGDSILSRDERLTMLSEMKEKVSTILRLNDKVRSFLGDPIDKNQSFRTIQLWEHLAELQQLYSLRLPAVPKLYFANQYDNAQIVINEKLFDSVIENLIYSQAHNAKDGYLTMSYKINGDYFTLTITCINGDATTEHLQSVKTESGLGLSVSRMMLQRLWGKIDVTKDDDGKIYYTITLPTDIYKATGEQSTKLDVFDELPGGSVETYPRGEMSAQGLPLVLIGILGDASIFRDQHLFRAITAKTSDEVESLFREHRPDMVFIDYNLKGNVAPLDSVAMMRKESADTPIVVTADYAHRILHRKVRDLGAQYLLTNPLTLRKVNEMIRKYLK